MSLHDILLVCLLLCLLFVFFYLSLVSVFTGRHHDVP